MRIRIFGEIVGISFSANYPNENGNGERPLIKYIPRISHLYNSINCFRAAEIKRAACAYLVDGIIISWYNND